jgi:hypothetical protein
VHSFDCDSTDENLDDNNNAENNMEIDEQDENFTISEEREIQQNLQMRTKLPNLAEACDRYQISDRAAACIVSSALQDIGVITTKNRNFIIDRHKIARSRTNRREFLGKKLFSLPTALYFDGKKDISKVNEKKGSKYYMRSVKEEHVTLVEEPGSKYIGHVTVADGSALSIKSSIIEHFNNSAIPTERLKVIGADGTNVNTGSKSGVIRLMELELKRPVHWFICLLHANELPFRHLFRKIDGVTCGPNAFSGPIGKALPTCEVLPICNFKKIRSNPFPTITKHDLSTDQNYLLAITTAVSTGVLSNDLAMQQPGPISHARWLTTACRILRLYVATRHPTKELNILVTFIMKVYVPSWFNIKVYNRCINGPQHIYNIIKLSRYLPITYRKIVDKVIQNNGYFCQSENILLAMLGDTSREVRDLAVKKIGDIRNKPTHDAVRKFKVPSINFKANCYTNLIDWNKEIVTEPPLTSNMSVDELIKFVEGVDDHEIFKYPCHTQGTERCIRLVSKAAASVCGTKKRHGMILSKISAASKMKTFNTKAEYNL